jgi:signal transduction histidine kinase
VLLATSDHLVDPVAFGIQVFLMVLGTVAAALVWIKRRPGDRIGPLLLAFAFVTAWLALEGANDEILHSLGVAVEPAFFLLGYLVVFAFPEGRTGRAERLVLAGMSLYFLLAFVPWLFFSPVVVGGAPLAGCNASCPANAFMIADEPGIAEWYGTHYAWAVIALTSATIVLLIARLATASRPRRRTLLPVYVPALVLTVPGLLFHGFAAGIVTFSADTLSAAGWWVTGGRTFLAVGFLLAIAQASLFAGAALKRLMAEIGSGPNAARLRDIVAVALDDRSVELAFKVGADDDFVDSRGRLVDAFEPTGGRVASRVVDRDRTVGVIWHDPALDTDPELVRSVSQAMVLAREKGRLQSELDETVSELAESRARSIAEKDAGRRAVQRDLHDGAQQRLIALRMKVEQARELDETSPELAARLEDVGSDLDDVMRELRDLARGIYPPVLHDLGVGAALAAAARQVSPPAELTVENVGRYPAALETAVYFCCLEGLQNVRKHAGSGAHAHLRVTGGERELLFEIADDGVGYRHGAAGAGLTNMRDRMTAVGGSLTIDSVDGHGTRVRGRAPLGRGS